MPVTIRSEQTDGAFAVVEQSLAPRRLIPPHTHSSDVWVYVLDGEVGVLVAEDVTATTSGTWIRKPRNVPHAMWNPTDHPSRILEVLTPGGSERWFEEIAAADENRFEALCDRYGIHFLKDSPWTERLRKQFGLTAVGGPPRRRLDQTGSAFQA